MVGHLALDYGSGNDLMVMGSSPTLGSVLGMEPAWDFLSPSPSASPQHACVCTYTLSLSLFLSPTPPLSLKEKEYF